MATHIPTRSAKRASSSLTATMAKCRSNPRRSLPTVPAFQMRRYVVQAVTQPLGVASLQQLARVDQDNAPTSAIQPHHIAASGEVAEAFKADASHCLPVPPVD